MKSKAIVVRGERGESDSLERLKFEVERLAKKRWMDFDMIRRVVENDLPLYNPTLAQRRQYRECIARIVSHYRHGV